MLATVSFSHLVSVCGIFDDGTYPISDMRNLKRRGWGSQNPERRPLVALVYYKQYVSHPDPILSSLVADNPTF